MRDIQEIYDEMLHTYAERTGFSPGNSCDLAVRLWAAAAQIQSLEIHADWVLNQSFPQTADGVYLDYHGELRSLTRRKGTLAEGTIRFYVDAAPVSDMPIPSGTVCMTDGETRFQTTADVVLAAGNLFVDAPAQALEAGSNGNVLAESICILTACPWAVTGCTNPDPFTGGTDVEDDETYRERILETYHRLPNGANAAWYEQTAMSLDGIVAAQAVGRARGIGTVDVYVATESGLPSAEILDELQTLFEKNREIAVDVQVLAPEIQKFIVNVAVRLEDGFSFSDVKNRVEQSIATYFTGRMLGKPYFAVDLASRLYQINGVRNCNILSPSEDLAGADGLLRTLGSVTVTELTTDGW